MTAAASDLTPLQRRALLALVDRVRRQDRPHVAQEIAWAAGVEGARRRGNGAVKGSWSGSTAPGFALASTMCALDRRGLVRTSDSGRERRVYAYYPTTEGLRTARILRASR